MKVPEDRFAQVAVNRRKREILNVSKIYLFFALDEKLLENKEESICFYFCITK